MSIVNIILGALVGMSFTSLVSAAAFGCVRPSDGVYDSTLLHLIVGFVYGAVTGILAGAIISGLGLGVVWGMVFGLIYSLLLGVALIWITGGARWEATITNIYCASVIVNIVNGAVVSLVNSEDHSRYFNL